MWFTGVEQAEFEYIRNWHFPLPSDIPIFRDVEVIEKLSLNNKFLAEEENALDNEKMLNVYSTEEKAKESGDWLLWFDDNLVRKYSDEYGIILLKDLDLGMVETNWGLIEE